MREREPLQFNPDSARELVIDFCQLIQHCQMRPNSWPECMSFEYGIIVCKLFDRFIDGAVSSSDLNLWTPSSCSSLVSVFLLALGAGSSRSNSGDTGRLVRAFTRKVAIGLSLHVRFGPPLKGPHTRSSCILLIYICHELNDLRQSISVNISVTS